MNKVAIYVRVSTTDQVEDGYSIDEQVDKLTKYCDIKNWHAYHVYKDGGFTGSNIKRPALQQLLSDAKKKKFDTVLVYKLDRLSRSQKDTLYVIEDVLLKNDVDFVSLSENFDTSTPFGKAMIGILAVFAQLEREQIKERMQMGKVGRAKAGKTMAWAKAAFGYKKVGDTAEIIPIEAEIVKQIFETYAAGMSITKLVDKLNDEGHIGKDRKWSYRTVRQALDNPIYIGYNKFKGEIYKGNHAPIISEELYYKVQEELKIRQLKAFEMSNNQRPFRTKYMLSGLIRCGLCGHCLEVVLYNKKKDGTRTRRYGCISNKKHRFTTTGKEGGCEAPRHDMPTVEQAVLKEVEKLRLNPSKIDGLMQQDEVVNADLYKKKIVELDAQMEKLVTLYLEADISRDVLDTRKDKIIAEKEALEKKIEEAQTPRNYQKDALQTLEAIGKSVYDLTYEEQKLLVNKLIKRILLYPDKIDITWTFNA